MFGKLKDKLKGALSVFSKKTQDEADDISEEKVEEYIEVQVEKEQKKVKQTPVEKKKTEEKPKPVKEKKQVLLKKEETPPSQEKKEEAAQEKKSDQKTQTPSTPVEKQETPSQPEPIPSSHDLVKQAKQEYDKQEKHRKERLKQKKDTFAQSLVEEVKEESKPKEKIKEKKEEPVEEISIDSPQEPVEKQETQEQPTQEKKGFFKRIFTKKEEPTEQKEETKTTQKEPVAETQEEKSVKTQPTPKPKETTPSEEPKSLFSKLKKSLTTKTISEEKFEELFWELELILLENNVSVEVIDKIKQDLKIELVDKPLPRDVPRKINDTLKSTLTEILTFPKVDLIELANKKSPLIITFFGINGAGKTTSIAKLSKYFQKHDKSVVLAACDTFRAAAIQQLEEHANNLGVKMIKHDYGSDAAAVAFDAVKHAQKHNIDVVLIDTAGRLHSNTNLMAELEKIMRITNPDLKIFVGESITGNDCIEQAKKFNELVQMDGAILTKADVDEKGGAPLSISYTINKPILFLGMGQTYEDLEEFDANIILARLGF